MAVAGVTPTTVMETKLIGYLEDPLEGTSIFSRHPNTEGFFPFNKDLIKAIALLPFLTGPSNVVIDLPKVSPS